MKKVIWKNHPEDHDFPAAISYLSLIASARQVKLMEELFRNSSEVTMKAKDVIRAAGLPVLKRKNIHVRSDILKIEMGIPLSPILLVRGNGAEGIPLTIADGYHRACAVYWNGEDDVIHARLIDWIL